MTSLISRLLNSTALAHWDVPPNFHTLVAGSSGVGKSVALILLARARLRDPSRSYHAIDPEGELTPALEEFIAGPQNGCANRVLHKLQAGSSTESFGLGLNDVPSRDPQACNDAAVRARAVLEQAVDFGAGEFGPRIAKLMHLGLYGLALNGLPLVALPDMFATAGHLRARIGDAYPFAFMSEEWRGLDVLAEKNPRAFLEYRDPLISRLLPLFGSPKMRRIFGQASGRNVDFKRIAEHREVALLDLSGLEHKESVIVGTAYFSLLFAETMQRPLDDVALANCTIDECNDYLTTDVARGLERLRKRGLFLDLACQHFAQFLDPNDPNASLLSAVLTCCRNMVAFGGLSPDDADLIVRLLFTGNIELDTVWKIGSKRAIAVASEKVTLHSEARARHHAEQRARAISDSHTASRVRAMADATSNGWASTLAIGRGLSTAALPDAGIFTPPTVMSNGNSRSINAGRSAIGARSCSQMLAEQDGRAHVESTSEGSADGASHALGSHDAYVTRYADLETETYNLEEKIHAVTGLLINLPPRSCLVKVGSAPPVLSRTPDLSPNFRSAAFKAQVMPLFRAKAKRTARFVRPVAEIDSEIAESMAELTTPADVVEPDFAEPEPAPKLRVVKGDK